MKRPKTDGFGSADKERARIREAMRAYRKTSEGLEKNRSTAASGMAKLRADGREVRIPEVVNPDRRESCRLDLCLYYQTYYPHYVYLEPAQEHFKILQDMQRCILYGGKKAIAAPRGFGKDTLCAVALNWAMSYGHRYWPVYAAATKEDAVGKLENLKAEWETNDRLMEDFPEIAAPIRALERSPQRARQQRILEPLEVDEAGQPLSYFSYIKWGADEITFPTVHKSPGSGASVSTAGLDGAIRGKNRQGTRPDFAIINDAETAESARSPVQIKNRTRVIEQDVAGLAGPGKTMATFMLCTIIQRGCVADTFTDRTKKPAWDGERLSALKKFPEREDLWDEYMRLRRIGQMEQDPHGREAHRFYLKNRPAMDAGAVVTWEARYNRNILEDGEPEEVSALQAIYNQRCDNGEEFFFSELQNDPLPDNEDALGLTPRLVASRCSGYAEGIIPAGAVRITRGIDVGARELHSVTKAWMESGDSYVVDYARIPVEAPSGDLRDPENPVRKALEMAVMQALRVVYSEAEAYPYKDSDGQERYVDLTLVDSGFLPDVVYLFCRQSGPRYRPSKGFGTRQGQKRYASPRQKSKLSRPMHQCYASKTAKGVIVYHVNADYWKLFTQLRYLQDPDTAGACSLFGMDPSRHRNFGAHICAEQYDPTQGKWVENSAHNHFLDASSLADCAGGMLGIRIQALAASPEFNDTAPESKTKSTQPEPGRRIKIPAPLRNKGGARVIKRPTGLW